MCRIKKYTREVFVNAQAVNVCVCVCVWGGVPYARV